jgi:HNH endonuclease
MRRSLRQSVRISYQFRCGYCGVSETNMGAEMTADHFIPRIQGGDDSLDNLVYCCHACNEFKSDYWSESDDLSLLHPQHNDATLYYRLDTEGRLVALTPRGANHIDVLHLNRPELVAFRLEQAEIALLREINQSLRQQLMTSQRVTQELEDELERLQ